MPPRKTIKATREVPYEINAKGEEMMEIFRAYRSEFAPEPAKKVLKAHLIGVGKSLAPLIDTATEDEFEAVLATFAPYRKGEKEYCEKALGYVKSTMDEAALKITITTNPTKTRIIFKKMVGFKINSTAEYFKLTSEEMAKMGDDIFGYVNLSARKMIRNYFTDMGFTFPYTLTEVYKSPSGYANIDCVLEVKPSQVSEEILVEMTKIFDGFPDIV